MLIFCVFLPDKSWWYFLFCFNYTKLKILVYITTSKDREPESKAPESLDGAYNEWKGGCVAVFKPW